MLNRYIYWALLLMTCAYAFWRGRKDERIVAAICLLASIVTHWAISPVTGRYAGLESGVLLVDGATLAGFVLLALQSHRFWPLWVAGLQLTTSLAHFLKALQADLVPIAYAAAGRLWSYPILLILVIGTYRSHQRAARGLAKPG